MNSQDKKILIVGLGISGRSAARFLLRRNFKLIAVDDNIETIKSHVEMQELINQGLQIVYFHQEIDFKNIEKVLISPGISWKHPLIQHALKFNVEIIGEIELGCRYIKQPILGVTGTNGKTTVTMLVNHVLQQSGLHAKALGNIGKPLTTEIDESNTDSDTIVLELSSFQIETLQQKVLDAGLILNITPDHLDRYSSFDHYAQTKAKLKDCLKKNMPFYVEYQTWQQFKYLFEDTYVQSYGYHPEATIYTDLTYVYLNKNKVFELPTFLKGKISHDLENLMAAYALCQTQNISGSQFIQAFLSFDKPPHRIQFIQNINHVSYYDDSKGTNIDAVRRAVQTFESPLILIAGGLDKGLSYKLWIPHLIGRVKKIIAIGQAAAKIYNELNTHISVEIVKDLEQAVKKAAELAQKGDCVLLSPGCASQDMFRDYAHRGEVFQQAVRSLVNKGDKKNV